MAEALTFAFPIPFSIAKPETAKAIRIKETLFEGIMSLLERNHATEKNANRIKKSTFKHVWKNHKKRLDKKKFKKQEKEVKVEIGKTHEEAAEKLVGPIGLYESKEEREKEVEERLLQFYDGALGTYSLMSKIAAIDMQNIGEKYTEEAKKYSLTETERQKWEKSSFYQTVVHETIHSIGGFENKGIRWLDEGVTEVLMRDVASAKYQKIIDGRWERDYETVFQAAKKIMEIVGKETVVEAYFAGRTDKILQQLRQFGFTQEKIFDLFAKARATCEGSDAKISTKKGGKMTQNEEKSDYYKKMEKEELEEAEFRKTPLGLVVVEYERKVEGLTLKLNEVKTEKELDLILSTRRAYSKEIRARYPGVDGDTIAHRLAMGVVIESFENLYMEAYSRVTGKGYEFPRY